MRQTRSSLALLLVALVVGSVSSADDEGKDWDPSETLKATAKKAREYRELFEKAGRDGLADFLKDKDTGVSLQAAWELNRKVIKLPKRPFLWDTDEVYDPEGMKAFLKHVNARTGLTVPDWWQKNLLEHLAVHPKRAHIIMAALPELKVVQLGSNAQLLRSEVRMAEGDMLSIREKMLTFTTNKNSVSFRESLCPVGADSLASCTVGDTIVLAVYSQYGEPCPLLGFDRVSKKHLWSTQVWGVGRNHGANGVRQRIELVATKETVNVFGSEFAGMFLESFDLKTGEVRFRFCSSYWRFCSEAWNWK